MVLSKFQRLICLLLLAAYTVTGTSTVQAAVMLLATLDGSHSILVNESKEGTQLILHHPAGSFTARACDHSSRLERVMVRFCNPNAEGDHRMLSAHVAGTINAASKEAKHDIANVPAVNDQATSRLATLNLWPVRATKRAQPGWTVLATAMQSQHQAIATVQLVI